MPAVGIWRRSAGREVREERKGLNAPLARDPNASIVEKCRGGWECLMSAVPFSKISAPLNALLAATGLLMVALLTTPDLTPQARFACQLVLVAIWVAYVLQLVGTVLSQRHRLPGGTAP